MINRLLYTLQIADNALILGHRISEWCGHGPVLEQDIALTNIALDHLGQARSLYQYAATQFNALPQEQKEKLFTSASIQQLISSGKQLDEDDLAYLRDSWDFRNILLAEQPNKDWAYTVIRSFFYDCYNYLFYTELQKSNDEILAAVAEKSLKEVTYHLRWSSEWVIRLGDGTDESHSRMQQAVSDRWMFTGEMLKSNEADKAMAAAGIGVDVEKLVAQWKERVASVFEEATLTIPPDSWMQEGGKEGRHTEHLGYILAELQFMQRAYPDMEW
jgi:ring-1,2-phenylacetyl-CoA epoxidase subunit PaaC